MLMLSSLLTSLCDNSKNSASTSNSGTLQVKPKLTSSANLCYHHNEANKEKLEEIAITTVNAECSAIIMNKVPEKLEDPGKFLIPCALQELKRTSALADSGASINLLPHSIYKKLELEALTPTRMTLELANRSISHRCASLELPFLRTAKALIDLYEEKLTLRVGKDELVYYADKSEKNKEKNFVHAISVIDFSKDDPFSGSTTTHSDDPSPSSSPVKTSDNFVRSPMNLLLLIRYHRVMMIQLLRRTCMKRIFKRCRD
ncbi:reverse transcriptase domain-containing protein [Tanacetum coccineum]